MKVFWTKILVGFHMKDCIEKDESSGNPF